MSKYSISLSDAKNWVKSWRTNPPTELAKGHLITGEALSELLATEGVVDVRAYMGVDESGTQKLIFVGVDEDGKDLIDDTHLIYDKTCPCPTFCDPTSPIFNP